MRIQFTEAGRTYEWLGGFGAIFTSIEKGITVGDVRVVNGEMFYAASVTYGCGYRNPWRGWQVSWTQTRLTIEKIRSIKAAFFGIETPAPPPFTRGD